MFKTNFSVHCPFCAAILYGDKYFIEWDDNKREFLVRLNISCSSPSCEGFINKKLFIKRLPLAIAQESSCSCGGILKLANFNIINLTEKVEFKGVYVCEQCNKGIRPFLRIMKRSLVNHLARHWLNIAKISVDPIDKNIDELKVVNEALKLEKDSRIRSLENFVNTALQPPNFDVEKYNHQGDNIMSESFKQQFTNYLQGAQFAGGLVSNADTVNTEQIGGNITNYGQEQKQKEAQAEANNSAVKTILMLASNPKNTSQLRLDEEIREIDVGLQRAKKRELFDLKQRWAVRIQDVYQALLDLKPQIVHFSGHGVGDDGLALEDEAGNLKLVDTEALAKLFELFSTTIECVVLNACYSEIQAEASAKHIPYVIGMNKAIGDKTAVKFSTGFYNALGAGESVEFAYKLGCNIIQLDGITEHLAPVLKKK